MKRRKIALKRAAAWLMAAAMVMSSVDIFALKVSAEEIIGEVAEAVVDENLESAGTTDGAVENIGAPLGNTDGTEVTIDLPMEIIELPEIETSAQSISLFSLDDSGKVALKSGNYANWIDRIDATGADYATTFYNWLVSNSNPTTAVTNPESAALFDPTGTNTGEVQYIDTNSDKVNDTYVYLVTEFSGTDTFNYVEGSSTNGDAASAAIQDDLEANWNSAGAHITGVYSAFDRDHPEVFWLSGGSQMSYTASLRIASNGTVTYTQPVYFVLKSDEFDIREDCYQNNDTLTDAINKTLVSNGSDRATILAGVSEDADTYETVRYFNEWLTKNNCYNSDVNNAGHDARECTSALNGTTGTIGPVCEGYARAFKVLCDAKDIPCVLVDGEADNGSGEPEAHMWNYVQMDDNKWYAVDVTWNDPATGTTNAESGSENENYFLVGSDTEIRGMKFIESHPVSNTVTTNGQSFTNGPVLEESSYVHVEGAHTHNITYTASGATITANCTGCDESGSITLTAEGGTYTGSAYVASYGTPTGLLENEAPVITYKKGEETLEVVPVEAGTYIASITVGDKTVSVEFVIVGMTLDADNIVLSPNSVTYNGTEQRPTVTVTGLTEGVDYSILFPEDMTNAGEKTITVSGKGQYSGSIEVKFTIKQATINHLAIAKFEGNVTQDEALTKVYDGTREYSGPAILEVNMLNSRAQKVVSVAPGVDCTARIEYNSANVGCREFKLFVTISDELANNFTNNKNTFEWSFYLQELITARPITVTADDQTVIVNGTPDGSKVTVGGEYGLVDGHTINVTYAETDTSVVGEQALTIETVTITDADGNDVTANYSVTSKVAGTMTVKAHMHDWRYTASNNTITATCVSTFGVCSDVEQSITLVAPTDDLVYDGRVKTASIDGAIDGETLPEIVYEGDGLVEGKPVNAGDYKAGITVGGAKASVEYTISAKDIRETDVADIPNQTYTGQVLAPDFTVVVEGVALEKNTDYTVVYNNNTNAGDATVTVRGKGNYSGTVNKTFVIEQADTPVIIWPTASDLVYGQTLAASVLSGSVK